MCANKGRFLARGFLRVFAFLVIILFLSVKASTQSPKDIILAAKDSNDLALVLKKLLSNGSNSSEVVDGLVSKSAFSGADSVGKAINQLSASELEQVDVAMSERNRAVALRPRITSKTALQEAGLAVQKDTGFTDLWLSVRKRLPQQRSEEALAAKRRDEEQKLSAAQELWGEKTSELGQRKALELNALFASASPNERDAKAREIVDTLLNISNDHSAEIQKYTGEGDSLQVVRQKILDAQGNGGVDAQRLFRPRT
jgi:hypothetical protein